MTNKKTKPERQEPAGEQRPVKQKSERLPPFKAGLPALQTALLNWYSAHARAFVWRAENVPPYVTLVAEIMLQQTQTTRVQEKLPEFLELFPNVQSLAAADNASIIRAWSGMGYNNRALRLRDCARAIVGKHAGIVPDEHEALLALPGIGPYTAAALCAFAFHQDIAVLDVNIRRVYSRLFWRMEHSDQTAAVQLVDRLAHKVFPRGRSAAWHQALMDLGATVCIAFRPRCEACALSIHCASAFRITPRRPEKKKEAGFQGTPNRIWRGKIVEILRNSDDGKWCDSSKVLQLIMPPALFSAAPESETRIWLHKIVRGLERDGLLEVKQSGRTDEKFHIRLRVRDG